jgi:T5SS/PEP-CTERM-associated repeat protein
VVLGSGSLTVSGGAKLFTNGTLPQFGSTVGGLAGQTGTATVTGATSSWTSPTAGLYVGNVGGTGILNINAGGTVSNGEAILGRFDPASDGTVNVDGAGSSWTNSGRLDVGLVGKGTINVTNGGALSSASARIGGQASGSGAVSVGSGSTWTNTGTLDVSINGPGSLTVLDTGVVNAPGGTTINTKGVLAGTGTINSNVNNSNGIVAPGAPTGMLTIGGTFHNNGKLQIDLASAMSFDKVNVSGTANLFGSLDINLMGSYVPAGSDTFEILTAGSRMFTFGNVTVRRNGVDAGTFNVEYTPTSVILSAFQSSGGPPGVAGDYNGNLAVDAADYVLWRNNGPLLNEVDAPGTVNAGDYDAWRARFGNASGSGAGSGSAVPEPRAIALGLFALIVASVQCRLCRQ